LKSSVFAAGLEEAIRDHFPEITWVSVQLSGTKMTVNVKEDDQPKVPESDETPCHVISTQNGVITSIVVRSGETELKQGDPITAGQILIFGEVNLKDDGGNVTDTKVVHADGEVYAKVTYRYSDRFPLAHEIRTYQEDTVKQYALRIGNYRFLLPKFGKTGEKYDVVTEKSQLYLGSDFYFPCYLETNTYRNYELAEEDYSKEAAETLANERMENYLKKLEENGYEIDSVEMMVTIDGQTVVAEGEFSAISQVGEKEFIKDE
jgi:similar to stage IV sporulation protein